MTYVLMDNFCSCFKQFLFEKIQKCLKWQICNSYETRKVVTYMTGNREREREREGEREQERKRERKKEGNIKSIKFTLINFISGN